MTILNQAISGVSYYYSTDGGKSWIQAEEGSVITIDENVDASYIFKAVNGAGVESNYSDSYRVMIDTVAPTLEYTLETENKTDSPYNVSFKVNTGRSGLKSVSVNGEDITGKDSFEVAENGKYVVVMTANNGLTSTEVIKINNISVAEKPVLYVIPSGTIGSETDQLVCFNLSSPNCGDGTVYYYNDGNGWKEVEGDTFVVSRAGNYKLRFKAVNNGLESYQSPEYNVSLTKSYYKTVFKTTVLENPTSTEGTAVLQDVKIYVDDKLIGTTDTNGEVTYWLVEGEHNVLFDNGTFNRTQTVAMTDDGELNVPMVALDLNKDGVVNAKDYVMLRDVTDPQLSALYNEIFMNFYNESEDTFTYQNQS